MHIDLHAALATNSFEETTPVVTKVRQLDAYSTVASG